MMIFLFSRSRCWRRIGPDVRVCAFSAGHAPHVQFHIFLSFVLLFVRSWALCLWLCLGAWDDVIRRVARSQSRLGSLRCLDRMEREAPFRIFSVDKATEHASSRHLIRSILMFWALNAGPVVSWMPDNGGRRSKFISQVDAIISPFEKSEQTCACAAEPGIVESSVLD